MISGRVSLFSYSCTFYISAYSCVIDIDFLLASGGIWEMVLYWEMLLPLESFQNMCLGDFPGVPVVKTLCFHITGHGFDCWSRDEDTTCCPTWPKKQKKGVSFLTLYSNHWRLLVDHRKEPMTLLRFFRIFTVCEFTVFRVFTNHPLLLSTCGLQPQRPPKEAAFKLSCMSSASSISLKV